MQCCLPVNLADSIFQKKSFQTSSKVRPLLYIFNSSVVKWLYRPEIVRKPVPITVPEAPELLNLTTLVLHFVMGPLL